MFVVVHPTHSKSVKVAVAVNRGPLCCADGGSLWKMKDQEGPRRTKRSNSSHRRTKNLKDTEKSLGQNRDWHGSGREKTCIDRSLTVLCTYE
jgi:hypothetical protein